MSASPGILLVDKPMGVTSHDVVARVRHALGTRRVGHAGTLDPMATGLLILGVESATKLLTYLVGLDKEYAATIRLGQATATDDAGGEPLPSADAGGVLASDLSDEAVATAIRDLTGRISQVPSAVSAIKVNGVRAYRRVRDGEQVELAAREVEVTAFDVLARRVAGGEAPGCLDLDVRVEVSSGTYVRALARDLGAALGVGGHLTALRRSRVGPFRVEDAVALPAEGASGAAGLDAASLNAGLRSPAEVAAALYPAATLDEVQLRDLAHGKRLALEEPDAPVLALLAPDGRLAGLVAVTAGQTRVLYNSPTVELLG